MLEREILMSSYDTKLKVCISICCKGTCDSVLTYIFEKRETVLRKVRDLSNKSTNCYNDLKCISTVTNIFSSEVYVETTAVYVKTMRISTGSGEMCWYFEHSIMSDENDFSCCEKLQV